MQALCLFDKNVNATGLSVRIGSEPRWLQLQFDNGPSIASGRNLQLDMDHNWDLRVTWSHG
eukprot:SAG31_NODE_4245_length_3422_cov_11.228408_1_plen_61_part_00